MDKWLKMLVVGLLSDVIDRQSLQVVKYMKERYGYDLDDPGVGELIASHPALFIKRVVKSIIYALKHG